MLQFASPAYFYALVPLALLAAGVIVQVRRLTRRRARLADADLLPDLTAAPNLSRYRLRWLLGLAALACWIVALANPQFGTRERVAQVEATEVVDALDISESMLTEDVRPSRLDRARNFLLDFIAELDGEQVGLVLFAGGAYVQMPLTSDYAAARLLVRSADPRQAPTQGTNFAAAIGLARRLLAPDPDEEASVGTRRVLVLVSDGENHEELAEASLREAAEEGLTVYTVGVGTAEGGLVPARSRSGGRAYKRGPEGEPVVSQFDPAALQELAAAGRGRYYDLSVGAANVAGQLAATVGEGSTGVIGEEIFRESASYFQAFVALGLLLLGLAKWISERPTPLP